MANTSKTLVAVALVITMVTAGWWITRPRSVSEAALPPNGAAEGAPGRQPKMPEDIASAQKRLRQTSALMQKQLIPLLKGMPAELKRVQGLVKLNDELISKLSEMDLKHFPKNR